MRMPRLSRPDPGQCPRTPGLGCWCANARCMSRKVPQQPPPPRCRSASSGGTGIPRWTRPGWTSGTTRPPPPPPPARGYTPGHRHAHGGQGHLRQDTGGTGAGPLGLGSPAADAEWKGMSATWVSYGRALQPVRPIGFEFLGVKAQALRDWIVPKLTGERTAGTPSLTRVFSLIGRDVRAAQEAANSAAWDVSPQDEPTPAELGPQPEDLGPGRACYRVPVAQCPR